MKRSVYPAANPVPACSLHVQIPVPSCEHIRTRGDLNQLVTSALIAYLFGSAGALPVHESQASAT